MATPGAPAPDTPVLQAHGPRARPDGDRRLPRNIKLAKDLQTTHGRTPRRPDRRRRSAIGALALALLLPACQAAGPAFGPTPAKARENATAFFEAFANRFTNPERDATADHARRRMSRHALTPRGIIGDSSVWNDGLGRTGAVGTTRTLVVAGRALANRYRFEAAAAPVRLVRPGDSRHVMRLTRAGDDVYHWETTVDMAVGPVMPDDLHAAWRALLLTAERGTETSLRADYRAAFPRTTQALGRMLSLDTIHVRRMADGSQFVRLHATLHPDRVRQAGFPAFGRFLQKYVGPTRYTLSLGDGTGAHWVDARLHNRTFVFQFRVKDGRMLALDGTPRPFPRHTILAADVATRIGIFGVGVEGLRGELTLLDAPHERGWLFRFREEPDWKFPLAMDRLIRTPLRRPFADEGVAFRVAAVAPQPGAPGADDQTVIARHLSVTVEESTIMRWLGGLGFTAMSDFQGEVEQEESRFLAEVFRAMAEDVGR